MGTSFSDLTVQCSDDDDDDDDSGGGGGSDNLK
jgi:hypothetical protein